MLPKLNFKLHKVLINSFFIPSHYGGTKEEFEEEVAWFIKFFKKNEKKIMSLISTFGGFNWSQKNIPIYIVPQNRCMLYSFAKFRLEKGLPGVVQKIMSNRLRNVHILIHELCHINQYQSDFYDYTKLDFKKMDIKTNDLIELSADILTLYVLRAMFGKNSKYEKDFFDFLKNTNDKNKRKWNNLKKYYNEWDLNKKSLRLYLAKN